MSESARKRKPLIYLASAYSYTPAQGYADALRVTAALIRAGHHVVSPIVHSHALVQADRLRAMQARRESIGSDWETWRDLDMALLERCDVLMVFADHEGHYKRSVGVQAEIGHAFRRGLALRTLYPETVEEMEREWQADQPAKPHA